jgi:hypothetical protein
MTNSCVDVETFTWNNLQADIFLGQHAHAMRLYLENVVTPALDAIEARLDEMSRSNEPADIFGLDGMKALQRSTIEAFALSLQSLWERQLREFLKSCACELKRSVKQVEELERAKWETLLKRFQELRGLPLDAFDSFRELELLHLLGNACRHGDGSSARTLSRHWPELWPNLPWSDASLAPRPAPLVPDGASRIISRSFSEVSLSRSLLVQLTYAVIWFWEDHNYIYTNSITVKNSSINNALAKMREERARRRR